MFQARLASSDVALLPAKAVIKPGGHCYTLNMSWQWFCRNLDLTKMLALLVEESLQVLQKGAQASNLLALSVRALSLSQQTKVLQRHPAERLEPLQTGLPLP